MSQPSKHIYTPDFIFSFKAINNMKMPELEDFLRIYNGIEELDRAKPMFSQTTKYKSFPLNFIPKRFSKKLSNGKRKLLVRGEGVWRPYIPLTSKENMKQIIVSTLNKLTSKNFSEMSAYLLKSLYQINCTDALDILATEILKKAYYDSEYIHLYVTLCSKIWQEREWNKTLFTIISNSNTEYYWCENRLETQESISFHGPFKTDKEAINDAMMNINFKKNLMNHCHNEFQNRMKHIEASREEELDDEDRYKKRRRVFSLLEFLALMYNSKYLPEKIMHIIIMDLLKLNKYQEWIKDQEKVKDFMPDEEDVEGFVILWKIIYSTKRKPFVQKYIDQYLNCIEKWLLPMNWNSRMKYMLIDVIEIITGKSVEKVVDDKILIKNEEHLFEELNLLLVKFIKDEKIDECIRTVKKYNVETKVLQQRFFETILTFAAENESKHMILTKLIKKVYDHKVYLDALSTVISMLPDLALDTPNVAKVLGQFAAKINESIDHKLLKEMSDLLKIIDHTEFADQFTDQLFRTINSFTKLRNKKVLKLGQMLKEYHFYINDDIYNNLYKDVVNN